MEALSWNVTLIIIQDTPNKMQKHRLAENMDLGDSSLDQANCRNLVFQYNLKSILLMIVVTLI